MTRRILPNCLAVAITACISLAVSRVPADPPSPPANKPTPKPVAKSLDEELLEGLDSKLTNGIDDKPAADPAKKPTEPAKAEKPPEAKVPTKKANPSLDPLDEQLRDSLTGGEDLGSPGEDQNPLARIVVQMRQVQQRLAESKSDNLTQKEQQRISDELKSLIEQMVQQQQQQQSSSSSSAKQEASRDKPKQGNGPPGKAPPGDPNKDPSKGSSSKIRPNHSERPDPVATRKVVKKELDRLHLPDKDREEMLQAPPDEFLPGHESSIEQYFQRLIEQDEEAK